MTTNPWAAAAALLLTYLIQSTLLLGTAWVLHRWVLKREAWREIVWKAALVGGFVTTAATALEIGSWGPRLSLPAVPAQSGFIGEVAKLSAERWSSINADPAASPSPSPSPS